MIERRPHHDDKDIADNYAELFEAGLRFCELLSDCKGNQFDEAMKVIDRVERIVNELNSEGESNEG